MVTTEIINETFIRQIVSKHAGTIYDTQADVIYNYLNERTGNLKHSISQRQMVVAGTNFSFPTLTYLRFLDIHYSSSRRQKAQRAGLALYNRVIWGVLYGEAMPELRYGLTQDIKNEIHKQLEQEQSWQKEAE